MASQIALDALAGVYEDLGLPARFAAKGSTEDPANVKLLPDQGQGAYQISGFDVTASRNVFTVRKSDVPTIGIGDIFEYPSESGMNYKVATAPRSLDPELLEWTLELTEVSE